MADAARIGEEARKTRMRYSELNETVEFLNAKHGKLLAQMERKQKVDVRSARGNSDESPPARCGLRR